MVRHQKLSNFYDIAVQTEQIGDIKISEEAINKPKKALIVTVAFYNWIYSFNIFSIFYPVYSKYKKKSLKLFFIVFSPDFVCFF